MQNFLKIKYISGAILFALVFFLFGIYIGGSNPAEVSNAAAIIGQENAKVDEVDLSSFWKVWKTIDEKYPGAEEITENERVEAAISGLLQSLDDPYSVYFNPEETKSFKEDISGTFSGVGMEVGLKDNVLTVIAPLKDTPAYRAGILSGDKIFKIDDTETAGFTVDRAVKLIRGERGTTVTLTILRAGERDTKEIKIVRDIINMPTIETELRADKIFVIKLFSFSANSPSLFRNALRDFAKAKTDKLIVDLRGNPGGYLDAAVSIASWFLPAGKVVVTEDYGADGEPNILRSKGYDVFEDKLKLVVLIDGGSASASEIVAGAIQDHKRGFLIGDTSYGKGSVQEVINVTRETVLKITVAKWLTPNGNSISEKGLTPDYVVKLKKEDLENKNDLQLQKAVQVLNNWPR